MANLLDYLQNTSKKIKDFITNREPVGARIMAAQEKGLKVPVANVFDYLSEKPKALPKQMVLGKFTTAPKKTTNTNRSSGTPPMAPFFEKTLFPITTPAGIPKVVAASMLAGESRGLEGLGAKRNNPFNIKAYDSNPNAASSYRNLEEGIKAFVNLLLTDPRYAQAMKLKDDPESMLKAIQNAGYAGDPKTYKKRSDSGYNSYFDFLTDTPEWRYYLGR